MSDPLIVDLAAASFDIGLGGEEKNVPVGTWSRAAGPHGPACHFDFVEWSQRGTFATPIAAGPEWDQAAGISFWVKGDGSKDCAAIGFGEGTDEQLGWEYWFSIESTEWRQLTVPWCEFMPLHPKAPLLHPVGSYRPSDFRVFHVGKRVWRRDCPAFSLTLGPVALQPEIPLDTTDYTPAAGGTARFLAKLQAKQPVSIVTIGDSLTDPRHWANVEISWRNLLARKIKQIYDSDVTLLHAGMGGGFLTQALTQTPFWLPQAPEPDLITVWFGANEYWNKITPERFRENLRFGVDHLRRLTKGKSELLLFTCLQLRDEWDATADLAQVVRDVVAEKCTGLVEMYEAFTEWGAKPELVPWIYAWDGHLAAMGHALVAKEAWEAIVA